MISELVAVTISMFEALRPLKSQRAKERYAVLRADQSLGFVRRLHETAEFALFAKCMQIVARCRQAVTAVPQSFECLERVEHDSRRCPPARAGWRPPLDHFVNADSAAGFDLADFETGDLETGDLETADPANADPANADLETGDWTVDELGLRFFEERFRP